MTDWAATILMGAIGLIVGSFIGLVSLRFPQGEGVILGRSRCGGCRHRLPPWSLVPVVSYAATGGRCRACGASIPVRYPVIEISAGAVGVWAALSQGSTVAIVLTALLGWQLLLVALIDGEHFWLPDVLTVPLALSGLAASAALRAPTLIDAVIGVAVGFASLWLIGFAYRRLRGREGLGGGDPFLFGGAGAWVGWTGLPTVLLWACFAGLAIVVALRITRGHARLSDRIPFGPCIAAGLWLTYIFGVW